MTGTKILAQSLVALFAWLVIGSNAFAETTYNIDNPDADEEYTKNSDILVYGYLGGTELTEFQNIRLVIRMRNIVSNDIQDEFTVTTDDYGYFEGYLDTDGPWTIGGSRIQLLRGDDVKQVSTFE